MLLYANLVTVNFTRASKQVLEVLFKTRDCHSAFYKPPCNDAMHSLPRFVNVFLSDAEVLKSCSDYRGH